jgi:hypothetical protein
MKIQKWLAFFAALALIGGTAGALNRLKANQRLGEPGIKSMRIPGSMNRKIDLPARVLDFTSTNVPEPEVVVGYLPKDTSYTERHYQSPDGMNVISTIVLMGADRTSIHKPDYCLPGQGWRIDSRSVVNLSIGGDRPYQLPVSKWLISRSVQTPDGTKQTVGGIYVFWFVADGDETPGFYNYLERLTFDLLHTGVLKRWAYVSYFASCEPGQEDAVFARLAKLIAASVPEFQPPPDGPR